MKLVYLTGPSKNKVLGITPLGISIGRESDNDIVLDDSRVSRYHAKIELSGEVWYARDLGSKNGVYLNGERIDKGTPLSIQDKIKVADLELMFCDDADPVMTSADDDGRLHSLRPGCDPRHRGRRLRRQQRGHVPWEPGHL